jgi:hypothetical protein
MGHLTITRMDKEFFSSFSEIPIYSPTLHGYIFGVDRATFAEVYLPRFAEGYPEG